MGTVDWLDFVDALEDLDTLDSSDDDDDEQEEDFEEAEAELSSEELELIERRRFFDMLLLLFRLSILKLSLSSDTFDVLDFEELEDVATLVEILPDTTRELFALPSEADEESVLFD